MSIIGFSSHFYMLKISIFKFKPQENQNKMNDSNCAPLAEQLAGLFILTQTTRKKNLYDFIL
jgi:hypothetical protein